MITIGIDVSKEKLDVLWIEDNVKHKVKTKVFSNNSSTYPLLAAWALRHTKANIQEIRFVMEATGIYHEPLAYALFNEGAEVSVVNPARINAFAKSLGIHNKTDKRDSYIIARYGQSMDLRNWQPEPEEIRELKALIARYQALQKDLQREQNRLEKASITQVSNVVLTSITNMIEVLKTQKAELKTEIDHHPGLKKDRQLLESIPGVGEVISMLMVAVIRSREFNKAPQCAAFLGLTPVQRESGTSGHKAPRLSKMGDGKIRSKLYLGAVVATRYNPDIKRQYERLLKNGKSKMSALGAAMRKLVQICFGVLKHQCEYQPQSV